MFKFGSKYSPTPARNTPLANKRKDNHNSRIQEKKKMLEEYHKGGGKDKALFKKIYSK